MELAKRKLILATIGLLAAYGVDAVSLRMINRASGSKNNSALHYHFGSKLRLVEAVDQFIQSHFDAVREPGLIALEHHLNQSYSGDLSVKRLSDLARFYVNTAVTVMTAARGSRNNPSDLIMPSERCRRQ